MKNFALIALAAALLSGFIFRGSFGHALTIYAVGIYLGAPLLLIMTAWLLIGFKKSHAIPRDLKTTFSASVIIGISSVASLALGKFLHQSDIRMTRQYVAIVVPLLDEYRIEHGRYPASLSVITDLQPPALLRDPHGYRADADGFQFEYWDPAGMMDGYCFDSSTRNWYYFD